MQDTSRGCVKVSTLHNSICRHCRRGSTYKSMLWSSNTALMPFPGRSVAEWVTVAKCGVCVAWFRVVNIVRAYGLCVELVSLAMCLSLTMCSPPPPRLDRMRWPHASTSGRTAVEC